jgi:hypothetical protein
MREAQDAIAALPGLALAGNYTIGVSVEHAARSGTLAAERLLAAGAEVEGACA